MTVKILTGQALFNRMWELAQERKARERAQRKARTKRRLERLKEIRAAYKGRKKP